MFVLPAPIRSLTAEQGAHGIEGVRPVPDRIGALPEVAAIAAVLMQGVADEGSGV